MAPPKGFRHSIEARASMAESRKGKPHSAERKAKIAAANRGRVHEAKFDRTCPCGTIFSTAAHNARFCSLECKRAASGHGIRHSPEFRIFPQRCAICAATEELVGDHCHTTGRPRGILCRNCNLAIGNMADDPARLRAAATYLERK